MRYARRHPLGCCLSLLLAVALFNLPATARAQGIFLTGIGPVNQGMGGAAVAAPLDSAGALAWNPATISGLKRSEMEVALGLVLPTNTVSSQAFGLAGSTGGEPGVTPIPTMSFVLKDNSSPWTWGVGVFGIGGFSTNYPASSLTGPTVNPILTPQAPPAGFGVGRVYTNAEIYQIAPTVSYALTDKLSIGFAPTIDVAKIQADPLLFAPPTLAFANFTYGPGTGTRYAWGAGFQIGAYYITDYNWRLGFSYKSTQWFEPLRYNSNTQSGDPVFAKVNFNLPSITSIGFAYTGFERLLYAVDVRWFDYSNASGFNGSGFLPDGSVAGLGWRNIVSVANGLQYNLTDTIDLRGGYTFVANPVPSSQSFFNIGTPLIMQHFVSIGGSWHIRQNVAANIAYTHGFRASITGPWYAPGGVVPGTSVTSTTSADMLSAGLTVQF